MISFVIPAHNAEKTIERTIKSLQRLDISKEVIVVENGSSDNTNAVLNNISGIRVFHSMKGVSRARNVGIDNVKGEFISFIDADDECVNEIEDLLTDDIKCFPDIIIAGFLKDNDPIVHEYSVMNQIITDDNNSLFEDAKQYAISRPTRRMQAWAKIYRTEFLKNNNLKFNEDLSYSEDSEFVLRVLEAAKSIMYSDKIIYRYNSGSISAMRGVVEGRTNEYIKAIKVAEKDVEESSELVKKAFIDYVIAHINIIAVHDVYNIEIKDKWLKRRKKIKEILKEDVFIRTIKKVKPSLSIQSIPVILCKYKLYDIAGFIFFSRSIQNKKRTQRLRKD